MRSVAAGRTREPLEHAERGPLFEGLVLHELRAAINEQNLGGALSYWRTTSGSEVDFIWERGKRRVGIEVKSARTWRREDGAALAALKAEGAVDAAFGVYTGKDRLRDRDVLVLPIVEFMRELAAGRVLR